MSKNKKVFFLLFSLNMGGVEKSFLNLISDSKFKDKEIHLGLLKKEGEFLKELPSDIIIHECCKGLWDDINKPLHELIIENLKTPNFTKSFIYVLHYLKYKISKNKLYFYRYIFKDEPEIDIEFDEAYAYAGPATVIDYYIVHKLKAQRKYGYIHYDVSKFFIEPQVIKKIYKNYNKIYIVSKEAKNVFDKKFPDFKDKTELRLTPINQNEIKRLSQEGESYSDKFDGKRILTVGRISKEKGQDLAIEALNILIEKGYNLRWYFIGEGKFLEECRKMTKDLSIENNVMFFGKKINPYPFMKDCDFYVQPSRHEGFCLTLAEAICLDKPIVSTDFSGASEQLKETANFVITCATASELAKGIMKILTRL